MPVRSLPLLSVAWMRNMLERSPQDATLVMSGEHTHERIPGEAAIWVFILGDMLMFAAFFGQFAWDRIGRVELYAHSQQQLNVVFGAVNTLLLLTGSLFVVFGVEAFRSGGIKARLWFAAAFACALAFGVDKVLEYGSKWAAGITPDTNIFFLYYYMFTGIHALHLCIGMIFLARMWVLAGRLTRDGRDVRFAEIGASYWHLVDLLWVVLFALLYLMN